MAREPDPADLLREAHFLRAAAADERDRARRIADQLALAAEEKDRLRAEWDALDAQRRRLHAEWAETQETVGRQETAVAAREKELAGREKELTRGRDDLAARTAALAAEAAGLDARVANSRAVIADLEAQRDRLHAELLTAPATPAPEPPGVMKFALNRKADQDLTAFAADLDAEAVRLAAERAALADLRVRLDREAVAADDQKRVLAEQFVLLARARGEWQGVERAALGELEDLTRALRTQEQDHAAREARLVRSDARRREEGYELWQLRLRLEAWQSKLVAVERRWHAERETRDADYARRLHAVLEREHGGPLADADLPVADEAKHAPPEGDTLREEFERLAGVLLKAELPPAPDSELPWGNADAEAADETDDAAPNILPFPTPRAA